MPTFNLVAYLLTSAFRSSVGTEASRVWNEQFSNNKIRLTIRVKRP